MTHSADPPMLGVGSDAVLAALATVVRKPKRQPTKTKSSGATATQAPATPKFPLKTLGPSDTDAPLFNTVVPTVLLKTRKSSAISAPRKVTRMGSPSTKRPPGAASRMVGIGNDEELATSTTTVRKLKSKTGNISIPGAATFPLISVGPLVADIPMPDTDAIAVGANTLDAESPHPSTTTVDSLLVLPRSEAHSPFVDTSLSIGDSPKLGAVSRSSVNTKLKQSAASIDPSSNPIEVPNFVDLTESITSPRAKPNSLKHQKMVECPRYNINVSRKWEEHDMSKCTVLNTVVEVLPDIRFTDSETSNPTAFNQNRTEVKKRAKGSVVDFWFNGDSRGENELVKYVKDATKTIKIGVDILHHEGMIKELGAAVGRGVVVQVFIHFKKARDGGLAWIKELLEAGVQVCHSTEKFEWKLALFDGQILVQGSQSSMNDPQEFNMDHTMMQTGAIGESRAVP